MIADWEEVASAQSFSDIRIKRFKSKEVTPLVLGESFRFPVAEGALRQPGADHLTSPQSDPFESGTGQPDAQTNSDGDEEVQIQEADVTEEDESQQKVDPDSVSGDSALEQEPVEQDFWSFNGEALIRHHRIPRSTLFVPSDPESPLPTKYLDVLRTTFTDLETEVEKRMEDF